VLGVSSFHDVSIGLWNCSYSGSFVFHFITICQTLNPFILMSEYRL